MQMQMQMLQLQMQEAQAKTQEMLARAKLQEARAQEALANVDVLVARKVDANMESIYAALQAAGIVLQNPQAARVADGLVKDAGYVGVSHLQEDALALLPQGGSAPATAVMSAPGVQPATGRVGMRSGIRTTDLGGGAAAGSDDNTPNA